MCDVQDVKSSIVDLLRTLKPCFVMKERFSHLSSLLNELLAHCRASGTQWEGFDRKESYDLITILRKLTLFLNIHFKVKERAPKELPLLRKLRTLLSINKLLEHYDELMEELKEFILSSSISSRITKSYLSRVFPLSQPEHEVDRDFATATQILKKVTSKYKDLSVKDKGLAAELISGVKSFLKSIEKNKRSRFDSDELEDEFGFPSSAKKEEDKDLFKFFNRFEFIQILPTLDEELLQVNRNIEFFGEQKKKKLQEPVRMEQVESSDVSREQKTKILDNYEGKFGLFALASLNNSQGWSRPILVQKIKLNEIKELNSNDTLYVSFTLRFLEMQASQQAAAIGLPKFLGHALTETSLYIFSERLDENIAVELASGKSYGKSEVLDIFKSICRALATLHQLGAVHGEVRPENVFIGKKRTYKLANFAYSIESFTHPIDSSKDACYVAPERLRKPDSALTTAYDMFGFAMVLWEVLHPGKFMFDYPMKEKKSIEESIKKGERPVIDRKVHEELLKDIDMLEDVHWRLFEDVIKLMWEEAPYNRATAYFLYDYYKDFTKRETEKPNVASPKGLWDLSDTIRRRQEANKIKDPPRPPASSRPQVKKTAEAGVESLHQSAETNPNLSFVKKKDDQSMVGRRSIDTNPTMLKGASPFDEMSIPSMANLGPHTPGPAPPPKQRKMKKSKTALTQATAMSQPSILKDDSNPTILPRKPGLSNARRKAKNKNRTKSKKMDLDEVGFLIGEEIGVDGLPRSEIEKEIRLWRESVDLETLLKEGNLGEDFEFDLDTLADECMKKGLDQFHARVQKLFGKGLKRFHGYADDLSDDSEFEYKNRPTELGESSHSRNLRPRATLANIFGNKNTKKSKKKLRPKSRRRKRMNSIFSHAEGSTVNNQSNKEIAKSTRTITKGNGSKTMLRNRKISKGTSVGNSSKTMRKNRKNSKGNTSRTMLRKKKRNP